MGMSLIISFAAFLLSLCSHYRISKSQRLNFESKVIFAFPAENSGLSQPIIQLYINNQSSLPVSINKIELIRKENSINHLYCTEPYAENLHPEGTEYENLVILPVHIKEYSSIKEYFMFFSDLSEYHSEYRYIRFTTSRGIMTTKLTNVIGQNLKY